MITPPDSHRVPPPERRLHPWSWLFVLLQQLKQFIIPLVIVLLFGSSGQSGERWNYLFIPVFMAVLAATSILRYFTFRYRIGTDRLTIRSGLLRRNQREIPFARIHNVGIRQSLLHRLFNVAEVQLESAGGQEAEAEMRVLALGDALALENLIRQRGILPREEKTPGIATDAPAQAAERHILLRLPTTEIIRLGLISHRGMIVATAALGLLWQILPDRTIIGLIENGMQGMAGYSEHYRPGNATVVIGALLLIGALLSIGTLLSVALALVQYHGFTLSEERRRLTTDRGLLMRIRNSAPRRRIQAWQIHAGPMHRLFRRRSLRVTIAVPQGDESRAFNPLAPIATPADCDRLIRHFLPEAHWPPRQWEKLPGISWWRAFSVHVLLAVPLSVALGGWIGVAGLWLLAWLPLAALVTYLRFRRLAYSVDERLVAIRSGGWSRYCRFTETDKIQALRLWQSPLDRCFGTASLRFDTAGGNALDRPLQIRGLPATDARALYDRLGRRLSGQPMRW